MKFRSPLARGVTIGTMLEDEALYFMRIGMHLERADNTARMLDVKFHERGGNAPARRNDAAAPPTAAQSEFYRWSALLSSVSGLEIYRKVYRDVITPDRVAELLILRPDMPRSLLAAIHSLSDDLARVANQRSAETQRRAGMLRAERNTGASRTSWPAGCTSTWSTSWTASTISATASARTSWCPCRRRSAA